MPKLNKLDINESAPIYQQSKEVQEQLMLIYQRMNQCVDLRNRPFHYFDDLSLETMINEAVKRGNSYMAPRSENDWHVQVNMPETEDHIQNILSFAAAQRFRAEISARSPEKLEDKELGDILDSLNNWAIDVDGGDEKFIMAMQEMLIKGTVFIYEGYDYREREVKIVEKYDPLTLEVTKVKKKKVLDADRPTTRIVPIEDIYIPNYYETDLQKQPYIIEREELNYETAAARYGYMPKFEYVQRRNAAIFNKKEGDIYFYENWSSRVEDDTVEVLHYYDRGNDIYNIVCNGIMLTSVDNPIIFDHKEYPYSMAVNQRYAADFIWGKPFPMRLMARQDFLNVMYNMMGSRTMMSLMPAFLTSMEDEIEESEIGPMQFIHVNDTSSIRELNFSPIAGGDVQLMNMTRESLKNSGVQPSGGVADPNATATAVVKAQEDAQRTLGLLMKFMEWMTYRQTTQRISNLLQFYVKPNGMYDREYKEVITDGAMLSTGKLGMRIVRLLGEGQEKPSQAKIDNELLNTDSDQVEILYITPGELQDISYRVKVIPNSSIAPSKALEKAQFIEGASYHMNTFGQMMTPEHITKLAQKSSDIFELGLDYAEAEEGGAEDIAEDAKEGGMEKGEMAGQPEMPQIARQLVGNPQDSLNQLARG